MKPPGITSDLRVHMPTRTEDAVWNAVEAAVSEGWSPKQFAMEAWSAWETAADDRQKDAYHAAKQAFSGAR